jgi:hypothetical protein
MNIKALQLQGIDVHKMDNVTLLGFLTQMRTLIQADAALVAVLSTVFADYVAALVAFDNTFAQQRKWAETEDLKELDTARDHALSAFLNMLKAMTASPNAQKAAAARLVMTVREKYTLDPSAEYMKETTAIQQMVQEMDASVEVGTALETTGLMEFFEALKAANRAFLQKMNERTEAQSYQQKGIVRETRLAAEAAYRDLVKLTNAAAIMEAGEQVDYDRIMARLNAEIEHYRQILARKGSSGGDEPEPDPEPTPTPDPEPEPEPEPTPVTPE